MGATTTATILGLDRGSLPAWLSLVAGVIAGSIALRNLMHDRRDRRRSQAAKVACWWGEKSEQVSHGGPRQWTITTPGGMVRNASELPVHDVTVRFSRDGKVVSRKPLAMLPPASDPLYVMPTEYETGQEYVVTMDFRDSAGRLWHRQQDGRLTERKR